jgi:hypothetical protein
VVIDIAFCGICGTDIHAYQSGERYPPAICGHEWAGALSAIGRDVHQQTMTTGSTRTYPPTTVSPIADRSRRTAGPSSDVDHALPRIQRSRHLLERRTRPIVDSSPRVRRAMPRRQSIRLRCTAALVEPEVSARRWSCVL